MWIIQNSGNPLPQKQEKRYPSITLLCPGINPGNIAPKTPLKCAVTQKGYTGAFLSIISSLLYSLCWYKSMKKRVAKYINYPYPAITPPHFIFV
jgi:hypothetical protein